MTASERDRQLEVVEICAGAGGQTLGLERAGFRHRLAVELDENAARTLRLNLRDVLGYSEKEAKSSVAIGDVADSSVWEPSEYKDIDLLAGGVPCPPFSIAGKQLGANDERDLFAWAVKLCGEIQPKALLLENVRGLSANRFTAYRQHVLDLLHEYGYIGDWKLLHANEFGVSQLRPRFVLVALKQEFAEYFEWPTPNKEEPPTVGELLKDLMASEGWEEDQVAEWVEKANDIAPTIVGGSKKHGGADLGPTRAKRAWAKLGVDAMGVANSAPEKGWRAPDGVPGPKLTTAMVARIQGWDDIEPLEGSDPATEGEFRWKFHGRKTSVYRQIGNAFPPPVAKALGVAIRKAIRQEGERKTLVENTNRVLDPVYKLLRSNARPLTLDQIIDKLAKQGVSLEQPEVERHLNHLGHDFTVTMTTRSSGAVAYTLGEFKAFTGQEDHQRHDLFNQHRARIS
ncbi:DNA cytosine methyltransferase [Streptomyces minutiscleroticus]|uniref:Cytosine-specific methyltransferase n=1 Tax=Streptomyces minutiscleroticus TaxID=68238 RepID=A0A918KKF3_9ACTN|nr:DNA (cytosine-5-)-methyltransferase [Streptomyces minutiscleroticus]GGX64969.1 DNA cytosine methyltransferase [Streptomyces minutiscleroticus]